MISLLSGFLIPLFLISVPKGSYFFRLGCTTLLYPHVFMGLTPIYNEGTTHKQSYNNYEELHDKRRIYGSNMKKNCKEHLTQL